MADYTEASRAIGAAKRVYLENVRFRQVDYCFMTPTSDRT